MTLTLVFGLIPFRVSSADTGGYSVSVVNNSTTGTEYRIVVGGDVALENGSVVIAYNSTLAGSVVFRPEDVPASGVDLRLWKNGNKDKYIHLLLQPDHGYDIVNSNILDEEKHRRISHGTTPITWREIYP